MDRKLLIISSPRISDSFWLDVAFRQLIKKRKKKTKWNAQSRCEEILTPVLVPNLPREDATEKFLQVERIILIKLHP